MKTRNTISKITILALTITVGTLSAVSLAQAGAVNSDIKVSKSELEGKCQRSGGTFTEESDGTYGCAINYDDGSITVVSCDNPTDCFGYTDTSERRPMPGGSSRPEAIVANTAEYTPISVTRYTPISVAPISIAPISIAPISRVTPRLVAKLPTIQMVSRVR